MGRRMRPAPIEVDFGIGDQVQHVLDADETLGLVLRIEADPNGVRYAVKWADEARHDDHALTTYTAKELVYAPAEDEADVSDEDGEDWRSDAA